MSKPYIYAGLGTPLQASGSVAHSSAPGGSHIDKVLVTAWLLLLLNDGESYGWALLGALRERGIHVDPSLAYRALRGLERDEAVKSRWTASDGGPQRRCYRLTTKGRRMLAELAAQITASWQQDEAFVRAHARGPADYGPADGEDVASDAATPSPNRELVAAWLLLLLEGGASHGYGLRRALDEHHMHPDSATVYRVLRGLDRAGWVQSRWMRSDAGPRRRLYRIRAKGRRNRDELAQIITAMRDGNAAFLHAYHHGVPAKNAAPTDT